MEKMMRQMVICGSRKTKIYNVKDFDQVSEMMENHTDGFIKGAFVF